MDYVVAGLGIGAILALIGFALWELFGDVEEPGTSWLSRVAIGLMIGSLVIWSVTIVSLISHTDDSRGSHLVLLTTLVTVVAIGAGAFWYWRADRALAATRPRKVKNAPPREVPATMAATAMAVSEDVELTDWDNWPDRAQSQEAPASAVSETVVESVDFAPEVAVDADETSSDEDAFGAVELETEPQRDAPSGGSPDTLAAAEPDRTPAESDNTERTDTEAKQHDVLPPNVRLLPVRQAPAPAVDEELEVVEAIVAESVVETDLAAPTDQEPQTVPESIDVEPAPTEQQPTPDLASVGPEARAAHQQDANTDSPDEPVPFESTLLADVDGSLATDDGGYRSSILSDLGSDQLEGVGLARWRPDARLTDDDDEHAPPAKTGRR